MKIAVLLDGRRSRDGGGAGFVAATLRGLGHAVRVESVATEPRPVLDRLAGQPVDLVVSLVRPGGARPRLAFELAGALDLMRIPYTGVGPQGLLVGGDLARARQVARLAGVPVADARGGKGRALSVLVLGNRQPEVFPACECVGRGARRTWRRAGLSPDDAAHVAAMARRIHGELDLGGYHRIDLCLPPGLPPGGAPCFVAADVRPMLDPALARALYAPLDPAALLRRILSLGLRRPRPPEWAVAEDGERA